MPKEEVLKFLGELTEVLPNQMDKFSIEILHEIIKEAERENG